MFTTVWLKDFCDLIVDFGSKVLPWQEEPLLYLGSGYISIVMEYEMWVEAP